MTIHDEIDNYLAADLHSELSDEERNALHTHLVECADCRKLHQETKNMNRVLEEKFASEKPDAAFEQRMLAGFRNRMPQKTGSIAKFIVDLMRLRATQITAVAALLLALVQVGRMITGESATGSGYRENLVLEQPGAQPAQTPPPAPSSTEVRTRVDAYKRAAAELNDLNRMLDAPALSSDAKMQKAKERDEKAAEVASLGGELNLTQSAATPIDTYRRDDTAGLGRDKTDRKSVV